ncbi:MAG: hypothetical protein O7F71_15070, partial [Gammaproteobacteria bacterium]|nr:hypothetical protein [Gammaproteobacteria bacterium]
AELPENQDLAWDLDDFSNHDRAMDFVMQFESTLCVYSPSVEQLYTTYNMFFPKEWEGKLVILPDPAAYHDTFFNIESKGVAATGLYIVPGQLLNRQGLFLANIDENRNLGNRQIPFEAGIRAIMNKRPADDPFLPVLAKGDLREFEQSWPVMHLHRVKPKVLAKLSDLDRNSLANVITEKLESLFLEQNKTNVA